MVDGLNAEIEVQLAFEEIFIESLIWSNQAAWGIVLER